MILRIFLLMMVLCLCLVPLLAQPEASLAGAVTAAGTAQTTIAVSTPQNVTADLVVPATVTLAFTGNGQLTIATGKTLTIRGPLLAPVAPIFANALPGQGTVSFEGNAALQEVYPEWWGASPKAQPAINTPALQAAIYGAYGKNRTNGSEGTKYNRILKFSGIYNIDDELKCYHMIGFRWEGQNRMNSGLMQNRENRRIIDGQSISFGVFSNLCFSTSAKQGDGMALLDINYDGSQGSDLRPQNITFQDCMFGGNNLGLIGVWLCRAGGGAQGDNIRFYNCYASGFTFAAAVLGGNNTAPLTKSSYAYNAIYVQWIGGDIQACPKYGLASYAGSWIVKHITMENQCLDGVGSPTQSGADFYFEAPQNWCILEDIRSESLRFVQGSAVIRNCTTISWARPWYTANGGYFLPGQGSYRNALITGTSVGGDGKTYRVTAAPAGAVFGGLPPTRATATAAGPPATLTVQNAAWTPNEFAGYRVSILSATHGRNQYGVIAANTANTITLKDLGDGVYYKSDFVPHLLYPDFQIVNPSGDVDFVVEPNWGTQFTSTVKGLTTTWEEFAYNTVDGALGARFSGSIDGLNASGKVRVGASSIRNLSVSQQDWASDASGLSSSPTWEQWSGIYVRGGGVPWMFPANQGPITFPSTSIEQKGSEWIVWNRSGFGGAPRYPTLGIGPGDDAFGGPVDPNYQINKDILAFWGKLGRQTPNGVNKAGSPLQLQGGLSTGSAAPGAIEFWFGKTGAAGTQVNGPAVRQAVLDANGLALGPGTGTQTIGAPPSHGQSFQMLAAEELVTIAAAASSPTTMRIPADAVVYAISVRVIEAIPTAATFTVSCGGHTFSTVPVSVAAGSTNSGTAGAPFTIGATPSPITLTPDRAPADNHGRVRVTVHYYVVTPPTN
ncbi:MAG: hypothetical protein ACYDBB_16360 [Armatimonadota bacterium]